MYDRTFLGRLKWDLIRRYISKLTFLGHFTFMRLTCWGLGKKNHGMMNVGQLVIGFLAKDQLVKKNDGGPRVRRERKRV